MKLRKFRLRTLLILVAVIALLFEAVGLGRRSRHYATQAQAAASAEQINLNVVRNSVLAASQASDEANRIAASEPEKAAELRSQAERNIRSIPFHEAQARNAAAKRAAFERAVWRPWEGDPPDAQGLATTAPLP